jgi:hypothetical protein
VRKPAHLERSDMCEAIAVIIALLVVAAGVVATIAAAKPNTFRFQRTITIMASLKRFMRRSRISHLDGLVAL